MQKKVFFWLKHVMFGLLVCIMLYLLWHAELVIYGIKQGMGQAKILWNAEPVETYLQRPEVHDTIKYKLRLIQEIRCFAFDNLGLERTSNYTTFYDQKNKPLLWVVTACQPFAMQPKEWNYAVLGRMAYKGFFDKAQAKALKQALQKQGYDADIDEVAAWSTLGWFKDPVLSSMLKRKEGFLANLIIHELTHSTIYVKNDVDFNENLADFIGDKGAELFLKQKFGHHSDALLNYQNAKYDNELFYQFFLRATAKLKQFYASLPQDLPLKTKRERKQAFIQQIVQDFAQVPFRNPTKFSQMFDKTLPNNTFFMHFVRYRGKQQDFEQEFRQQYQANLPAYIQALKKRYASQGFGFLP